MLVFLCYLSCVLARRCFCFFFFNDPAPTEIYTLSLHDALPISLDMLNHKTNFLIHIVRHAAEVSNDLERSEEHTSELQSPDHLVCRLLLEKKKFNTRVRGFSHRCNTVGEGRDTNYLP